MNSKIGRRHFLGTLALVGAAAAAQRTASISSAEAAANPSDGITAASASELAAAIRSKQFSSREVVEAHLQRIATVNPKLNAVVQLTADSARKEADEADAALARGDIKGPLHGVPLTIKDTLETAGVICTGGTKGRANFVPKADATAVARLRAAGGVVLGKTNVPELAGAAETDNLVYGRTNNPYDLTRTPGGSSGGEAAIIAAGGSPLGLGTDAGGSIRIPAHYCRLAAIKPTAGRVPRTGQFLLPLGARNPVFHDSLIARKVEDLALALPIVGGPDFRDHAIVGMPLGDPAGVALRDLKVAVFDDDGVATPTREIKAAVRDAARALADAGVKVEENRPPDKAWHRLFRHQPRRRRRRHKGVPQEHRDRPDLAAVRAGADGRGGAGDAQHHRGAGRVRQMGPVSQFDAAFHRRLRCLAVAGHALSGAAAWHQLRRR